MPHSATQFQFGPFSDRFEKIETLYFDPGFSQILAKDRVSGDEVRLQLLHLHTLEGKETLPLQWEALKSCRDSLWIRPQEWLEKHHYGILLTWVPPGRYFSEIPGTLSDEVYLKWLKEALQDLNQLHRRGLLHLAQNQKTWILFKSDEERGEEGMGLSDVGLLTEVPLGQTVSAKAMVAVPPEILQGKKVDVRADLYALAALILRQRSSHLFERMDSFQENLKLHWHGRLAEMVPQRETTLNDLLRQMLQVDPEDRPANAQAILNRLDSGSGEGKVRDRSFPEWSQKRTRSRQNTLILNTLFTLIDSGENETSSEMMENLENFLKPDHEAYLRYLQARLARNRGEAEEAKEFRRQAEVKCYTQPDPKLKSLLALEEAHVHWEEGRMKDAVNSLDQAWEAIEKYPAPNLQIRILYERGRVRKRLGEDVEALVELRQAFDHLPDDEEHPGKGPVYSELSELLTAYHLSRQAKPLMVQALTYPEEDRRERARRYVQAALGSVGRRDWEIAAEQFKEARFLFSALKDLSSLIWAGAHGVRLHLARRDIPQARRELKALRNRNRKQHYHEDLLDLLELSLWLESGETLHPKSEVFLDRIQEKAQHWVRDGFFCDLGWPPMATAALLEMTYQKLRRFLEAGNFAKIKKDFLQAMEIQLAELGYQKESVVEGPAALTAVTPMKVESLLADEEPVEKQEEVQVTRGEVSRGELIEEGLTSSALARQDHLSEHVRHLEHQLGQLETVKDHLLRENQKLRAEMDVLRGELKVALEASKPDVARGPEVSPPEFRETAPLPESQTSIEIQASKKVSEPLDQKEQIIAALRKHQGSRSAAAKDLGIHRRTLFQKIKKYGLDEVDFQPGREELEAALAKWDGNKSHAAKELGMSRSSFYRRLQELDIK